MINGEAAPNRITASLSDLNFPLGALWLQVICSSCPKWA
ncbi:hypothetical protein D040_3111 [Vibrio parahaemolyticus NIHCB0603]|nr:hypothetical protein D040_3111 [Vibrio parahaemolyticus NIHCB0603]